MYFFHGTIDVKKKNGVETCNPYVFSTKHSVAIYRKKMALNFLYRF